MKTVEIIYRYEARDVSARPLPSDSNAAMLRLDDGNRGFAALLDHVKDETGVIQQIIPVDARDLGLTPGSTGAPKQRPFAAVLNCFCLPFNVVVLYGRVICCPFRGDLSCVRN